MENAREEKERTSGLKRWAIRLVLLALVITSLVVAPWAVAIGVTIILISVLLIYWWIMYKIKKFLGSALDFLTIKIIEKPDAVLQHPQEVASIEDSLRKAGFERIGYFCASNMPEVTLIGYHCRSPHCYAAVYDAEFLDACFDFVCKFEDDSYLTYSTNTLGDNLERSPEMPIVRIPDADVESLFKQFVEEIGDRPLVEFKKENFAEEVEAYVSRETAWQAENYEENEALLQEIRESFLEKSRWSAIEWDRNQDRVLFIHEKMQPGEVVDRYTENLFNDDDLYEEELQRANSLALKLPALKAFEAMVDGSPTNSEFTKVAEIDEPVAALVYLAPEEPEYEDEEEEEEDYA